MKENEMEKQEIWRPKIKFSLDLNQDIETFMKFWREQRSAKLSALKYLENSDDENNCLKVVEDYIKVFYQNNASQIENELKQGEKNWQEVEDNYYNKVAELFDNYAWPKGDYLALGSILSIYPRWIEQKKFTFPIHPGYAAWLKIKMIAHEMLHFITYDYLEKKHGLMPAG